MWEEPKTDWVAGIENGVYVGDTFDYRDFNRIKNNLEHLKDMASKFYEDISIHSLGEDRKPVDFFYADEINKLEDNLSKINGMTINKNYGENPVYVDNGKVMDFNELNRLEGAILSLHENLHNQDIGRRKLKFSFGVGGEL